MRVVGITIIWSAVAFLASLYGVWAFVLAPVVMMLFSIVMLTLKSFREDASWQFYSEPRSPEETRDLRRSIHRDLVSTGLFLTLLCLLTVLCWQRDRWILFLVFALMAIGFLEMFMRSLQGLLLMRAAAADTADANGGGNNGDGH